MRLGGEPEIVGPVHKVVPLSGSGVFSDFRVRNLPRSTRDVVT